MRLSKLKESKTLSAKATQKLQESVWNTDADTENIKHLNKDQIQRIYDKFIFDDGEIITDAYIQNEQLYVVYEEDGEQATYEPDLTDSQGQAKLDYIMNGKQVSEKFRKLKEAVSDEAYEIADRIDDFFSGSEFITRDDFDNEFNSIAGELFQGEIDWENGTLPNGDDIFDLVTDVRGILAQKGWETIYEGDDEGGLENINIEAPKKNELIYKALKEYEERHYDSIGRNEQEILNSLIDFYDIHMLDESARHSIKEKKTCKSDNKHKTLKEMLVEIDEDDALDLLMNRLKRWTTDPISTDLYEEMYQSYIDGGVWDGGEFNVMSIVDNDWVNYCEVVEPGDEEHHYDELLKIYEEQGIGDVSTEDVGFSYIEAAIERNGEMYFLCRW